MSADSPRLIDCEKTFPETGAVGFNFSPLLSLNLVLPKMRVELTNPAAYAEPVVAEGSTALTRGTSTKCSLKNHI
jgi:hypothetical protein